MTFLHWRPEFSLPEFRTSHVLALTATGLVTLYAVHKIRQKKYCFPPGPRTVPILGNLLSFSSEPMYLTLMNMAEKYGDIFTIYMGPNPMVVLNSLDVLQETFLKKAVEFSDRPTMVSTKAFGGDDGMIFAQYAPRWKKQRKIAHAALRKFATGSQMEVLLQRSFSDTCILIDKEGDQPIDIQPKLALMVSNVVSSMAFGKTFEMDDPFFTYIISEMDRINETVGNGVLADIFPILQYFPNPTLSAARNVVRKMTSTLQEAWNEHLQNHNPDQLTDFIHYLIATKNELQEDDENEIVLEEKHFHSIFSDLFLAGTDTTRTTMTWVLLLCAAHPEVQVKMQDEIDRVVGADQPIRLTHRPQLLYTEAVIQEAMRLLPVSPLSVPRATHCDVEIRGYTLPKGTWIVPNLWAIQHCASNWPDPDQFLPERHIQEDGTLAKSDSLLPFSTGRRRCTGEVVAKTTLHMFTAMLFQRYSFLPPEGVKLDTTPLPGAFCIPPRYEIVAHRRK